MELTHARRILKLGSNPSPEEVHVAYRERAKETHPDKGGDATSFRDVVTAYRALISAREPQDANESELHDATASSPQAAAHSIRWLRRRRWWLLVPTMYAYLAAPHMGWARLPSALRGINDALRSSEWVLALAYLLAVRPAGASLARWSRARERSRR